MSVKVIDILNDVASRAGQELNSDTVNKETLKTHLLRCLNFYHKDLNTRYNWPWRIKRTSIQTTTNYKVGSVTMTIGSRAVTGSGTSWDSTMAGRFIKLDREIELYEILSVTNATSLTLVQPYLGASGGSLTYLIWKKLYDLDPDVPYLSLLSISEWPKRTSPIPYKEYESSFFNAYTNGQFPYLWTWMGINRKCSTYGVGTVSTVKDSKILTGAGTVWLGNVFAGAEITISNDVYNVESVDSDTQITMVQVGTSTIAATTLQTYTITVKNRSQIALSAVPDPGINMFVTYFKKTYNLLSDNDELDIWEGYEHILTNVLYGYLLEKLTSAVAFNWLSIYEKELNEAWSNLQESDAIDRAQRFTDTARNSPNNGYRRALYG